MTDSYVNIGEIQPTPVILASTAADEELTNGLKQRLTWTENETQALFGALASNGKTLLELADAVGTRTMEQVYCKLQNTRYRFKTDDPEIRRVLRDEFRTYQHSLK